MSLVCLAVRAALYSSGAILPLTSAYADGPAFVEAQSVGVVDSGDGGVSPATAIGGTNTTSNKSDQQLEEVVVTGIRASLIKSMELKQDADQLVDAITAQDLGQFPDADIADSLSHIPGVAIDRDETGAGSEVTIRGFGPEFNLVLINGQQLPTSTAANASGGGRESNFDVLPSDMIGKAVVYKTAEAWQPDGAIGGLIELETAHPFDFNGFKATAKLQGDTSSLYSKITPNAFALVSDTFDDDRLGALISFSAQDQATKTRAVSTSSGWAPQALTMLPGSPSALLPTAVAYTNNTFEQKRLNVNASLQWKPTDNLKFTLDGLYNRFEETASGSQLELFFTGNQILGTPTIRPDGVIQTFTAVSHADNIQTRQVGQISPQYIRSLNLKIEGESFGDRLSWSFDGSHASNVADNYSNPQIFAVLGFPITVNFTNSGGLGIPSVTTSPSDLTDLNAAKAHIVQLMGSSVENDIRQFTLDGTWHKSDSWGPLEDIRFGAYGQRNYFQTDTTFNTDSLCIYCGYSAAVPSSLLSVYRMPANFAGSSGGYPSAFLAYDPQAYIAFLNSPTAFAEQDAAAGLAPGTTAAAVKAAGGFVPADPRTHPGTVGTVTEKTYAGYIQADFKGTLWDDHAWGGNLGLRWVRTEETAVGYSQTLIDIIQPVASDPTALKAIYAQNGQTVRRAGIHSYTYLLPSANFRLNLTRELVFRTAVSQSLSRPQPGLLSPVINYGGPELLPSNMVATGGNPNLKPYTTRNYDLSLEWYYSHDGYLAASAFRKELRNFIEYLETPLQVPIANSQNMAQFPNNIAPFLFNSPTNIGQAHVNGLELTALHMFSYLPAPWDGFGVNANVTIMSTNAGLNSAAASSTTQQTFGLTGLGDYQNLSLIYQKYGLGARVTYSHRNDYISQVGTGVQPFDVVYVKGYGTLDAQLNYDVTRNLVVSLSGTNLTNSYIRDYVNRTDEFFSLLDYGRRYALSAKVSF